MNSRARLAQNIGVVLVVAVAAAAALIYSSSRRTGLLTVAAVASPQERGLELEPVAARAQARVERLQRAEPKAVLQGTPAPVRVAAKESISRLRFIRTCEQNPTATCRLDSAVAKASASGYSDLLVDETIAELAFLRALAKAEARDNHAPSFSVADVASAYIQHRDDNVREQALGLTALLLKTEPATVVDIASRALNSTISGPLASQALELLEASRQANPQLVDKTLLQTLKLGGWDVRDTVAERLLPFLTRANRDTFAHLLAEAPVRSKLALRMRLNIEEFDRMDRL